MPNKTTVADLPKELQKIAILAFTEEVNTLSLDRGINNCFDISIAISSDGSRVAVGGNGISSEEHVNVGVVYIFLKTSTGWTQEARLVASNEPANKWFGNSVAISANGSTIVVGAGNYNINPNVAGSAYIFLRTGTTWTQVSKLAPNDGKKGDCFGGSVAISADGARVAIGAMWEDLGNTPRAGAVYIFSRSAYVWSQEAKLVASDRTSFANFGNSVSISGNGDKVIIGEYESKSQEIYRAGAAYIFSRNGVNWAQESKLVASDKAANDTFGYSVSISGDGSRVAIGSPNCDIENAGCAGAVYVFSHDNVTWVQEAKLTANDGNAYDNFGWSVSMSSDGARVAIGVRCSSPADVVKAGAAYIFSWDGTMWSHKSKLVAGDKSINDFFGHSIAISSNGARVVIGALKSTCNNDGGITDRSGFIYDYDIPNCQKLLHGDDFLKAIEDKIDKKDLPFISRLIIDYYSNIHTPKSSDPAKSLIPNEAVETVRISMDINDNIVEVVQSKFGYDFVYCHSNVFIFVKNKVTLVVTAI